MSPELFLLEIQKTNMMDIHIYKNITMLMRASQLISIPKQRNYIIRFGALKTENSQWKLGIN